MTTVQLIETIILILVVFVITVWYVVKAIKNKWLENINETIDKAIREAEDLAKKGELNKGLKKQYVLDKIANKCVELGIPYQLLAKLISKVVDNIVKNHNIFIK